MLSPGGINNESEESGASRVQGLYQKTLVDSLNLVTEQTEAKGAIGTANRTAVTLLMDQSER